MLDGAGKLLRQHPRHNSWKLLVFGRWWTVVESSGTVQKTPSDQVQILVGVLNDGVCGVMVWHATL
jgi:hypothetical protein